MVVPLNKKDIRKKSLVFWLLFLFLLSFSILPAYFFVWSADKQQEVYVAKVQQYRQMQNKEYALHAQIDSLYKQITYVSADKVDNYQFLEKDISRNKAKLNEAIGIDSSGDFQTYAHILKNINEHLSLRDSIIQITARETMIKSDLLNCIDRSGKIRNTIFATTQIFN
jgi:hypothetical protein